MEIEYTFTVNGQYYTNMAAAADPISSFEHISPGDTVTVYFLKNSPSVNCLGNPKYLFDNELTPVLLACVVLPTVIVIAFALRKTKGQDLFSSL
jgi:hypothetical protein